MEIFNIHFEKKINRRVVGFVGHYSRRKFTFVDYLTQHLESLGVELEIIGSGWDLLKNKPKVTIHGPVYGRSAYAIAHSWGCTLGLLMEAHKGAPMSDKITQRSFEEPAYGLAVVHQFNEVYKSYFPMAHTFNNPSDLVKIVDNIIGMSEDKYFEYRASLRNHAIKVSNTSTNMASRILGDFES
jgi:hypothetical protein